MRPNLRDATASGLEIIKGLKLGVNIETLGGQRALANDEPVLQVLDPGGAARDVLLPVETDSKGLVYIIVNAADAAENLVVKEDSDTTTIATVAQAESAILACDGVTWRSLVGGVT